MGHGKADRACAARRARGDAHSRRPPGVAVPAARLALIRLACVGPELLTNLLTNRLTRMGVCADAQVPSPRSILIAQASPLSMAWKRSGFESLSSSNLKIVLFRARGRISGLRHHSSFWLIRFACRKHRSPIVTIASILE